MIHEKYTQQDYDELDRLARIFSGDCCVPQEADRVSFRTLHARFEPEGKDLPPAQIPAACRRLQAAIEAAWEKAWEVDHAQTADMPMPSGKTAELAILLLGHQFGARIVASRFAWYLAYALDSLTPTLELPSDWHAAVPGKAELAICRELLQKQEVARQDVPLWAVLAWAACTG